MEIRHATRHGCVIVAFTGSIDLASVAQIQRVLLKHLSDQPPALICDLAGVRYLDPVFATVFSTVANHPASRWPTTNLLCAAQPQLAQLLHRVQPPHLLRLYASVEEALEAALVRPGQLRDELRLGSDPRGGRGRPGLCPRGRPALAARPPRRNPGRTGRAGGQRAGHQRRDPCPHRPVVAARATRRSAVHRDP